MTNQVKELIGYSLLALVCIGVIRMSPKRPKDK